MQRFLWFNNMIIFALLTVSTSSGIAEVKQAETTKVKANRLIYHCTDGYSFIVEFLPQGDSILLILPEKTLTLLSAPAASGAKYTDGRTTFWTKGGEAFLEVDGKIRYRGCRVKKE